MPIGMYAERSPKIRPVIALGWLMYPETPKQKDREAITTPINAIFLTHILANAYKPHTLLGSFMINSLYKQYSIERHW
jgi:hypothetical protein